MRWSKWTKNERRAKLFEMMKTNKSNKMIIFSHVMILIVERALLSFKNILKKSTFETFDSFLPLVKFSMRYLMKSF